MATLEAIRYTILFLIVLPTIAILLNQRSTKNDCDEPPQLQETIPFVSNAWYYIFRKQAFVIRLRSSTFLTSNAGRRSLKASPRGVIRCRFGPLNAYVVAGSNNVSALFRASFISDPWVSRIIEYTGGYEPQDVAKFHRDTSGGARIQRAGHEQPSENRIWFEMRSLYHDSLIAPMAVKTFTSRFQVQFAKEISSSGEWADVRIFDFLRYHMFNAATTAVFGPKILETNPGFVDAFWEYEKYAEGLSFGLPTFLNTQARHARERFNALCRKWFNIANQEFDWEKLDARPDAEFEPVFGARLSRRLAQWGRSFDFSRQTMGGVYGLVFFGIHSNTINICTWIMMELLQDPELFHAIKMEVSTAAQSTQDPRGQEKEPFDTQKLLKLPLLQSVFAETMRLHVSVLITRTCIEDVNLAGYRIPEGSMVQTPTEASHLDENIWGTPEHPASEFWAARHVKEVETRGQNGVSKHLEFSLAGKTGYFIPYGGGISMCSGRNFAKPEVLLAVATMVSRLEFDFHSTEWLKGDGSLSERPARDLDAGTNAVAAPPDRDLRVKMRAL